MSTFYYARIKPSEEDRNKLIEAIKTDNFSLIQNRYFRMYCGVSGRLPDDDNDYGVSEGGIIELGVRRGNSPFVWYANLDHYKYCDDKPKYYELTRSGIENFIERDDVCIYDEYFEELDKNEFMEMAFSWEEGCERENVSEHNFYRNDLLFFDNDY